MRSIVCAAALTVLTAGLARAADLSGDVLATGLRQGGYVLVMRHASSPQTPPSPAEADAGNPSDERQLDESGKRTATAMGDAVRKLHIRFGEVWSSPTYRALETIRLAGLPKPRTAPELGDQGHSMQAAGSDQSAWLKAKADEAPHAGSDTLIVTHLPNIAAAFGDRAKGLSDGEALVFRPAPGGAVLVARIKIDDWPSLAAAPPPG
jgi:phosphohistidine phosphatase SixA